MMHVLELPPVPGVGVGGWGRSRVRGRRVSSFGCQPQAKPCLAPPRPTQRLLEEEGEAGVPVRHVGVALGQRGDDTRQRGQALVDALGLGQRRPRHPAPPHTLAARQVDQGDARVAHVGDARPAAALGLVGLHHGGEHAAKGRVGGWVGGWWGGVRAGRKLTQAWQSAAVLEAGGRGRPKHSARLLARSLTSGSATTAHSYGWRRCGASRLPAERVSSHHPLHQVGQAGRQWTAYTQS